MTLAKFVRMGAAVGTLIVAAQANAADTGPYGGASYRDAPPSYGAPIWTGYYFGVNGGAAWANNHQLVDSYFNPPSGLAPSGGFGGGQIGYNWQGFLLFGIEADFEGGDIGAKGRATDITGVYNFESGLNYIGTVRGRVGYTLDRALVYFTGGFAYGCLRKWSDDFGYQRYDAVTTGYVFGGGLEYRFSPSWSVKTEYQYLNFGKNDPCTNGICFSNPDYAGPQKADDYQTVRVGLNYHIGGEHGPLK
jgi:outer membrane immunogenic protein